MKDTMPLARPFCPKGCFRAAGGSATEASETLNGDPRPLKTMALVFRRLARPEQMFRFEGLDEQALGRVS